MKFLSGLWICLLSCPLGAEILSIHGQPAEWMDIVQVRLQDLHPTQIVIGFDQVYYKLGRYNEDRMKQFDEYCEVNGQGGVRSFTLASKISDPSSFLCREELGTRRNHMKTAVIAPDNKLYLTDGHHLVNTFWHMNGGGPDTILHVIISRDYREFPNMEEFWAQMVVEKNAWFFDHNNDPISYSDLPSAFGLENFKNDLYRSIMFMTRRIVWNNPGRITVPDPATYEDRFPSIPFVEFYWGREVRKAVNLHDYNLSNRLGYLAAIRDVCQVILKITSDNVGGSGFGTREMGQFKFMNQQELFRISRPGTGRLDILLNAKKRLQPIILSTNVENNK